MSSLISITQTPSDGYTEPVTLADMKAYLRVDFTDDDDLITALITAARMKCEKTLGMVLVDTDITARYEVRHNHVYGQMRRKHRYEIFYGPILEESGVPAFTGLPDDAEVIGHGTSVWVCTYDHHMDITYQSGWDVVPSWAVLAIEKQVAWDYESRGDQLFTSRGGISTSRVPDIAPETAAILRPFSVNLSDALL